MGAIIIMLSLALHPHNLPKNKCVVYWSENGLINESDSMSCKLANKKAKNNIKHGIPSWTRELSAWGL